MSKQANANDLDLARLKKRIRDAYKSTLAAEKSFATARESAAARRLELGNLLIQARAHYPKSGPNAAPWGEFLDSVGIDRDVALDAMKYAGFVEKSFAGKKPKKLPTLREAGVLRDSLDEDRDEPESKPDRGAWCTPKPIAQSVGSWDLDPFTNPRSLIRATDLCMLEDGGDGFGDRSAPGVYRVGRGKQKVAGARTRVWLQPDYGYVLEAVQHYGHTQFCALLRLDPSTEWFDYLYARSELILIPKGDRIEFDPPPGVEASSNPYPHGLYYARAKDATEQIRELCYEWRVRAA
jgi:hypothetical protein